MTQEEKELLIQDICARLPYKIRMNCSTVKQSHVLQCMFIDVMDGHCDIMDDVGLTYAIEDIKPYLRPMSSMTEEERKFYYGIVHIQRFEGNYEIDAPSDNPITTIEISRISEVIDWLNKKMFDYRGLIPLGLGIDCTGLNIYENEKSI